MQQFQVASSRDRKKAGWLGSRDEGRGQEESARAQEPEQGQSLTGHSWIRFCSQQGRDGAGFKLLKAARMRDYEGVGKTGWRAHLQMAGLLQWSEEEMMVTRKGGGVLAVRREVFGFCGQI